MCDTLAAVQKGAVLFGKNSDRERNEAQALELHPRRTAAPGARDRLTYIDIPAVPQTHAVLLSRPCWMWGAEMGANEHGVVIGNEAMHAVVPAQRRRALTGMDLVRLGLERASTAFEAVRVIATLLEAHGQGGDCGHLGRFYYHNGFVVADAREAYVLETVGRWWIFARVEGTRTLSNALSIGHEALAMSFSLASHAESAGWVDADGRFDFAGRLIDPARDAVTFGRGRCARAASLLAPKAGRVSLADVLSVLRDHGAEAEGDADWSPRKTVARSICMHAAHGARKSQTVGSMASELKPSGAVHWLTGTAAPCLSVFKPFVFGMALPQVGSTPTDRFDGGASLWWRHEILHRGVLAGYPAALAQIAPERDALEADFRARMAAADDPAAVAGACWAEAAEAEARWTAALAGRPGRAMGRSAALAWARLNGVAGFPS